MKKKIPVEIRWKLHKPFTLPDDIGLPIPAIATEARRFAIA